MCIKCGVRHLVKEFDGDETICRRSKTHAKKGLGKLLLSKSASARTPRDTAQALIEEATPLIVESAPLQELARRELSRRSLLHFIQRFHPSYKPGWVHVDICRRLERFSADVVAEKSPRLILMMPPRHGKSTIVSRFFPAWHLGHHPEHEYIGTSYNLDLAREFSRDIRNLVRDPAYGAMFPGTRLDPDSQSVEQWKIAANSGGFVAAGINGGITGRGAHILSIDDPVKNQKEAESFDYCEDVWNWYRTVAYTRLSPGGGVLIIMTWWSDIDLAGKIQKEMVDDPAFDRFEVVKYPAINEGYDEYKVEEKIVHTLPGAPAPEGGELLRVAGSALHPERYSVEQLSRIRTTLSNRYWSALYQQNPIPEEGAFFKEADLRDYTGQPSVSAKRVVQAWDLSIGGKQDSDWIVGLTALQDDNNNLWFLDMMRFKTSDAVVIIDAILDFYTKWKPQVLGFEEDHIWKTMKASFEVRCRERGVFPPREEFKLSRESDKETRAEALRGRTQLGMVFLPRGPSWADDMRAEMLRFPHGAHDDIVDAAARCAHLVMRYGVPQAKKEKRPESWRDRIKRDWNFAGTHMGA
jgi:predicted phage terminase large subunit-like protein